MAGNTVRLRAVLDDKVSGPLAKIRDHFDRLGGKGASASLFGNVGAKAVAKGFDLIGQAASAATDYIFDSIEAASDLAEATSKSAAVFGPAASDIEDWAETASRAFGQSKRSALEAAGTYGNLFQAFGIGQDRAAEMSKALVELASDLASFNNTSVEDAIDALRSGLSGETEPLKRYGVALNDARLKEEALRLGLIKTTKGVLPQVIKTQAAYALVLRDTSIAQGDFERTADGLANTQKTLEAQMEDLSAEIGERLLPLMIELAQFVRDDVIPGIRNLVDAIDDLSESILGKAVGAIGELIGGMHGVSPASDQLVQDFYAAQDAAETSTRHMASATKDDMAQVRHDLNRAGDKFGDLATDAANASGSVVGSTAEMSAKLRGAVDGLIDGFFDPILVNYDRLAAKADMAAAERVLASAEATAAEKRDAGEAMVSAEKRYLEASAKLLETGDLTTKAQAALFDYLERRIRESSGDARAELVKIRDGLRALSGTYNLRVKVTGGGLPGFSHEKRAAGGPVEPFRAYTVGEKGPETLVMGAQGGYVIPNGATPTGGGTTVVHTTVNLDGRVIAELVDRHLHYAIARSAS